MKNQGIVKNGPPGRWSRLKRRGALLGLLVGLTMMTGCYGWYPGHWRHRHHDNGNHNGFRHGDNHCDGKFDGHRSGSSPAGKPGGKKNGHKPG